MPEPMSQAWRWLALGLLLGGCAGSKHVVPLSSETSVHDVGKASIPVSILTLDDLVSPLTDLEIVRQREEADLLPGWVSVLCLAAVGGLIYAWVCEQIRQRR